MEDFSGMVFGRLTCLEDRGRDKRNEVQWLCKCSCGNKKVVAVKSMKTGNTASCGCIKSEMLAARNKKHGLSQGPDGKKTRLYNIWVRMRQRCFDKNSSDYDRYGGRGIEIDADFLQYKSFHDWAMKNGYQSNLSIERIDNDGNYGPENCEWITLSKQARNKRNTHFITYENETKSLAEWSEILGISSSTLRLRLKHGWTKEQAFNTPVGGKKA